MPPAFPIRIVLPTYNEADNLESMLAAVLAAAPAGTGILVVDDASPDGTGRIADRRAAADGRIVQMDADFSHDPADLPRLIAATIDGGADVALGSRYVPGGGVGDWGRGRQAISRWGSIYARTWLGLDVHDLTGGFKCFRREALEAIHLETVSALGYAFQIETTYRAITAGFEIVEVPIIFSDRRVGESKMSRAIVAEAAWRVPLMRLRGARWR